MKILSWNVNGLRARCREGILNTLNEINADIVCLQEVRAKPEQYPKDFYKYAVEDHIAFTSIHEKAGYAGVLTIIPKEAGHNTWFGTPAFKPEFEYGREYISEFDLFSLINVYTPNSGRDLDKLDHRLGWEKDLKEYITTFAKKPFIICGDMNVAPVSQDCNVFSKAGTSREERGAFADLKKDGNLVDVFRELHPFKQDFTWYSNCYNSREVNKGMRIDHFLVSRQLLPLVKSCDIVHDEKLICGSDHCPIILDIDIDFDGSNP